MEKKSIQPEELVEYNRLIESRDRLRNVAGITFGAGVLFGVTGFLLYAFDQPTIQAPGLRKETKDEEQTETDSEPDGGAMEVGAAPVYVPGGAVVLVQGTF
ncbi:MAG: hypothetical protein JRI68_10680 [Deltaproteobacteria bacterium]|nr:hypothetical protein [Deltaproteobacteria bacterium]